MKFYLFLFSILISIQCSGQWTELNSPGVNQPFNNLPVNFGGISFTFGDTIYYGMGSKYYSAGWTAYSDSFYCYSISTGIWHPYTQLNHLIYSPRKNASSFTYNGKAYIAFGEDDQIDYDDLWELDVHTGVATQKASNPGGRTNAIAFVSGTKAYAGGGNTFGPSVFDFYSYDFNSNTWQRVNDLPHATEYSNNRKVLEIDGAAYMLLLSDSTGNKINSFSKYDTINYTWIPCASYPGHAQILVNGFTFNDQGFIGFGRDSSLNFIDELFQYDPLNNSWTQKNNTGFTDAFMYGYSNGIRCGLFSSDGNLFEYDITNDSWQQKVARPYSLSPGKMIVINSKAYGRNIIYDIPADHWTVDTTLNINWVFQLSGVGYGFTSNHIFSKFDPASPVIPFLTAPLPPQGLQTFFSIGNKGYAGDFYSDTTRGFWEFDPQSGQWSRKADFPGPKRDCNGGFSIGNKGYITGGWCDSIGWYIFDFWQYDPTTDSWAKKADGPTGYLKSFMEGDATRGYIGCGITDAIGMDNKDVHMYDPSLDYWYTLFDFYSPRSGTYSFIYNNYLFVGGGYTRYSMIDGETHYDFYNLPLNGLNYSEEIVSSDKLNIYPNPNHGLFSITGIDKANKIIICDSNGKEVSILNSLQGNSITYSNKNLSPGIYYLIVQEGNNRLIKKFVVLAE